MRCEDFARLLHAWADGFLSPEESAQMQAHAAECPACAEQWRALEAALETFVGMGGEAEVPEAAAMAWRQAVRAESARTNPAPARRRFSAHRWETWAGFAAGILILIGGANLVRAGRLSLQPQRLGENSAPAPAQLQIMPAASPPAQAPESALRNPAPLAEPIDGRLYTGEPLPEAKEDSYSLDAGGSGAPGAAKSEAGEAEEASLAEDSAPFMMAEEATGTGGASATEAANDQADQEPSEAETLERDVSAPNPLLEFLMDAGIFAALCLPVAAAVLWIRRLRARGRRT